MSFELEASVAHRGDRTITRHRHKENGLRLIHLEDDSAPLISVQTWFDVGSANERPGKTGIAHFFEHLMFTETRNFPAGEFDRVIEGCGGDTNAATWLDWTFYRDSVTASELETIIRLESDRMANLDLHDDIVESEREVILNERRERVDDDVSGFLEEQLMDTAFGAHPYGHPTIGSEEDIRGLTTEDLNTFYRTYYAPNNATLVVVGDASLERVLGAVEQHYGALPRGLAAPTVDESTPPPQSPQRRDFGKPLTCDRAMLGWVGPSQSEDGWTALEVAAHLLTGGPSARLYRELVVERELASSVSCSMLPLRRAGLFEIVINLSAGHSYDECAPIIDEMIASLCSDEVSEDEIKKVKAGMLTDFWADLVSIDGRAESFGHHELVTGDFRTLLATPAQLEALAPRDILQACAKTLKPSQCAIVVAHPQ